MIHATHTTNKYSEKETASGLPQLGLRFLDDSNSWNINGKPQNSEADAMEYWESWFLTIFLHSLAYTYTFSVRLLRTKFEVKNFLCSSWRNMVKENIMYQRQQKICREKVCLIKVSWANLGKFGQNIFCTPKKLPAPTRVLYFTA